MSKFIDFRYFWIFLILVAGLGFILHVIFDLGFVTSAVIALFAILLTGWMAAIGSKKPPD